MDNVLISKFAVKSEAYEAFSKLKNAVPSDESWIRQMALVTVNEGRIRVEEGINMTDDFVDDTWMGGMIGALLGTLGGPLGMLAWGGLGTLIGLTVDAKDASEGASLFMNMAKRLSDGSVAIVAVIHENDPDIVDGLLRKYDVSTERWPAAEVREEIEHARALQADLEKRVRADMKAKKSEERKAKVEEFKRKIEKEFEEFKAKFNK